jgi:hypothetical protein
MFITNMKHLNEYINEKMEIDFNKVIETPEINESTERWFRLNLDGFDGGYDTLKSIADGRKLYNEPIDGGIKIKVKEGQEVELPAVIEAIQDFINSKSEDENAQDTVARLNGYIEEMENYIDEKDEEKEETAKKEAEEKEKEDSEEGE